MAQADAGGRRRCDPVHPGTIVADRQAQVFMEPDGAVFGCVFGRARAVPLGRRYEPPPVYGPGVGARSYTLDGAIVAYEDVNVNEGFRGREASRAEVALSVAEGSWTIHVTDLRSGKRLRVVPTGRSSAPVADPGRFVGVGPVRDLVVTKDGDLAWIATNNYRSALCECQYSEVHVADRAGTRMLAAGSDIEYRLGRVGRTIYWTEAGRSRSASLR